MIEKIKEHIIDIPNFPQEGVMFRDITPLLSNYFSPAIEELSKVISAERWSEIDGIVGVESRGFIFASALAMHMNKNVIIVRKAGKLPPPVISKSYQLEYGADKLEMKKGGGNVLIVDDVLATGGTLNASAELCEEAGYDIKGFLTLLDLKYLNKFKWKGMEVDSLIQYEG